MPVGNYCNIIGRCSLESTTFQQAGTSYKLYNNKTGRCPSENTTFWLVGASPNLQQFHRQAFVRNYNTSIDRCPSNTKQFYRQVSNRNYNNSIAIQLLPTTTVIINLNLTNYPNCQTGASQKLSPQPITRHFDGQVSCQKQQQPSLIW